jgi:hypothetical protein
MTPAYTLLSSACLTILDQPTRIYFLTRPQLLTRRHPFPLFTAPFGLQRRRSCSI